MKRYKEYSEQRNENVEKISHHEDMIIHHGDAYDKHKVSDHPKKNELLAKHQGAQTAHWAALMQVRRKGETDRYKDLAANAKKLTDVANSVT